MIVSRQWDLNGIPAMVPVCDMYNHRYGAKLINHTLGDTEDDPHSKGEVRLAANVDMDEGEEAFISYGDVQCSRKWFHYYGFAPPDNDGVPCAYKTS